MDPDIQQRLDARQYDRAFDLLLTRYQDRVYRLCCAMLNDRGLAEEAAQDAFIRIWKALANFRGESALSTWIYAVTRNACLTAMKSSRSARTVSLDAPGIRFHAERSAAQSQPDRRTDVIALVNTLPGHYRQVMLLFHMQEKSYEEVAAMLDLPLGTVKTYLHRARKQLADAVQPKIAEGRS